MPDAPAKGVTERVVRRVPPCAKDSPTGHGGPDAEQHDAVAIEEPLEIRIEGETVAVTMRTPGNDADLAVGFLFAEGVIASFDDIESLVDSESRTLFEGENFVDARPRAGQSSRLERIMATRRGTLTSSACGVCGRKTIADLMERGGSLPPGPTVDGHFISACIGRLRDEQLNFSSTGGVHAAAAFARDGKMLASHEDVGRHNAADKVVGALLRRQLIGPRCDPEQAARRPVLMVVSGRASFELVQKTVAAGIPILASVSAASSLAIDLAVASGLTLVAFARADRFNIYAGHERIMT